MDKFKVYDLLPNGVIVFKNKHIAYMNKHILDVMNLSGLDIENATEIIAKTLNIKKDELFSYFSKNDYFTHGAKTIQIAQNNYNDIDVFSFMLISPSLIFKKDEKTIKKEPIEKTLNEPDIDTKVAKFFKLNNIRKIKILTFFKGLPLKNFAKILKLNNNFIEIEVDNKHLVSLLETNTILLLNNETKDASVLRGKVVDNDKNIFTIKNFSVSKENMHQREEIRVKPDKELLVQVNEKTFNVYDISQKAISICLDDNNNDEDFLKKTASMKLLLEKGPLSIDTRYFKTVSSEKCPNKVVFILMPSSNASEKIHAYILKRQNEIIREIHQYLELKDKVFAD